MTGVQTCALPISMVRRNKLLGLWVAQELLGLEGDAAETYAKEVVASDFEQPGHDDVVRKIMADLEAKGVDFSEHRLRHRMEQIMVAAHHQNLIGKERRWRITPCGRDLHTSGAVLPRATHPANHG